MLIIFMVGLWVNLHQWPSTDNLEKYTEKEIKVLCEQTREVNKLDKRFFGLCLILSGLGNIVVDFQF